MLSKTYFDGIDFEPDFAKFQSALPEIPEIAAHEKKVAELSSRLSTYQDELQSTISRIGVIEEHKVSNALDEYPSDKLASELKELKTLEQRQGELKMSIATVQKALEIKRGERYDHLLKAKGDEMLLALANGLVQKKEAVISVTNDLLLRLKALLGDYQMMVSVHAQANGKGAYAEHGALSHLRAINRSYQNTLENPYYFTGEIENVLARIDYLLEGVEEKGWFGSGKVKPIEPKAEFPSSFVNERQVGEPTVSFGATHHDHDVEAARRRART